MLLFFSITCGNGFDISDHKFKDTFLSIQICVTSELVKNLSKPVTLSSVQLFYCCCDHFWHSHRKRRL